MGEIGSAPAAHSRGTAQAGPPPACRRRPQGYPSDYLPCDTAMAFPRRPDGAGPPRLTGLSPRKAWFGLISWPYPAACPLPQTMVTNCAP